MSVLGTIFAALVDSANTFIGTLSNPLRTDPTGTTVQPVSGTISISGGAGGTVTANQGTANATPWNSLEYANFNNVPTPLNASATGLLVDDSAVVYSQSPGEINVFNTILGELRIIRSAMIKLACDDGRATPSDFILPPNTDSENLNLIN